MAAYVLALMPLIPDVFLLRPVLFYPEARSSYLLWPLGNIALILTYLNT